MTCCQRIRLPLEVSRLTHRRVGIPIPSWFTANGTALRVHQHRCLVSLPNYAEQRISALPVRSNSQIPCGATATDSKNQAIVLAAEEANRLLVQSAKHHLYYQSKTTSLSSTNDALSGHDESIRKEVIDAANKLLAVSQSLQEKIGAENLLLEQQQQHYAKYISVLHRAFLALTAKCLDAIRIIQASATPTSTGHAQALLDLSLALARRAHSLGLPFHLPLYQQLMEVTASTLQSSTDPLANVLLDVATYSTALNPSVPLHGTLFRPSLLVLIANKQFGDVVDLLCGMRDRHGLTVLDRETVWRVYTCLHATVKSSFGVRLESRRDLPESPVTEIVAILEPSIALFTNEWANEAKAKQDKLRHLLDSLDELKMESLISSLSETTNTDEDTEPFDSDDESDEYLDSVVMVSARKMDPLDLAVNSILSKRVKSEKVKAILVEMVDAVNNSNGGHTPPDHLPNMITVTANLTRDEAENVDYWAGECSDLSSDEDDDDQRDVPWMKSRRNLFPDISTQIVELNNGRNFRFTRNYEDIMWMNEGEEDFPDGMENPYESMYNSRLDDSDEDDSDDDHLDDDSDSEDDSDGDR